MEIVIAVIIALVVGALAGFLFFLGRGGGEKKDALFLLQNQINDLARTIDARLGESSKQMHEAVRMQFGESRKLIADITERLTQVAEGSKQVVSVADQLRILQQTLQNPKQRGVLGEYYLDTVLKNMFPPGQYALQYGFKNGDIVDAVIFLQKKTLPIDSKFSLENYNRLIEESDPRERERLAKAFVADVKMRINETAKYIRPEEGTMEFAFMFIPSEAIYYDLLTNKIGSEGRDLIEYAFREKKVIIVSPTSFMAYLQTVLQGLRALRIEESAKEIQKRVGELGRHIGAYDEYMRKLGNALSTTVNHYNTAHKELKKIDKDVVRITGRAAEVEPLSVPRPEREE